MGDKSPSIYLVMQEEGEERKPVRKAVTGCTRCQADISARQPTLNPTVGTGNQAEIRGMVQKESTTSILKRMQGTDGAAVHHVPQRPVTATNPAHSRPGSASQAAHKLHRDAGIVQLWHSQEIPPSSHS